MINLVSLHTHTSYSDGKNSMEEMVLQAISSGFKRIGFTDHSFVTCDAEYCMAYENYDAYKKEARMLKEKYADKIEILCGIEQDYYSDYPAEGFDYVIGSVHFIKIDDDYIGIDWGGEEGTRTIQAAAKKYFNDDIYALLEYYFETISSVVEKTGADIIGHFDVIRKTNEQLPFFDPENERYIAAWKKAVDILITKNVLFEINVSPLLNKTLSVPHPAYDIQAYIKEKGGKMYYTGDCHSTVRLSDFANYLQNEADALK